MSPLECEGSQDTTRNFVPPLLHNWLAIVNRPRDVKAWRNAGGGGGGGGGVREMDQVPVWTISGFY